MLLSCSTTNLVTMSVTEPAPVELPSDMKRVGLINRSLPTANQKVLNKIDQILSMEGNDLDREGAEESMAALAQTLRNKSRLSKVQVLETAQLGNPAFGKYPSPLAWGIVAQICQENKLDGLFVLEFYDTDGAINYSTQQVMLKNPLGIAIPVLEHQAIALTSIKTGWRIYDNRAGQVIDEMLISREMTTTGRGINPIDAVAAITGRKEAVKSVSYEIGNSYALSIFPYTIRVSRDYYVKGSDHFKTARRMAQTGNWDGAATLWEKETTHPKAKIAGRAYYNMAIISEINGDLDLAIDWSRKAYETYGDKLALRYLRILENRKAKAMVLARQ